MTRSTATPEVGLVALVAHARRVPSEAREAFADRAALVAQDPRAILVRTCHRAELYLATDPTADDGRGWRPSPTCPSSRPAAVASTGSAAARHLFTVAAGLDSVVVGEDQILHQLRECLADRQVPAAEECPVPIGSHAPGAQRLDPVLERLFQVALHLGRETRSWREGPPRSLADVALDRIVGASGPLPGRRVLVVGAGRMARLAALAADRRGARVVVANRSADRAAVLARDAHGETAAFGAEADLPEVDAIVLAIGGRWPLSAGARAGLLAGALPVVDLSSPPALDPSTREALGDRYTSVDDLAHDPAGDRRPRRRTRVERAVDGAEASFAAWVRAPGPRAGDPRAQRPCRVPPRRGAGAAVPPRRARAARARARRADEPAADRGPPPRPAGRAPGRRHRRCRAGRPHAVRAVTRTLRIGTRGSALALVQANLAAARLAGHGVETEIHVIRTEGDDRPSDTAWGEGAFVARIVEALIDGTVDIAVHSAKDVPTDEHPLVTIAAYPEREDPRDALVCRERGTTLATLPMGARVGTDSPRRSAFLRAVRPDLRLHPLHGNVDTRLAKLDRGESDALVLAVAGLSRLGRTDRIDEVLPPDLVAWAPGQGALALQVRADDAEAIEAVATLDDARTRIAVEGERALLNATGGGCRSAIGVTGRVHGDQLELVAAAERTWTPEPDAAIPSVPIAWVRGTGPRTTAARWRCDSRRGS